MSTKPKTQSMAVFCDFENIALGARDAKYAAFDIRKVLERLLLKGNIVVKKSYCDWERYRINWGHRINWGQITISPNIRKNCDLTPIVAF